MALRQPLRDLYEELGVASGASREEIAAAYRAQAKRLHPDTRPVIGDAADRFGRISVAYRVLSDPEARARYDRSRREMGVAHALSDLPPVPPLPTAPPKPRRLTRRGARRCVWGGVALIVLGLVVGTFVFALQRHDAELRANGVATTAVVVPVNGERRLEFETADGRVVRAKESIKTGEEEPAIGSRVRVHYDPDDPTSIVTDETHTGRNVTLWIVAVKFVLGGGVLIWFGLRRLRQL